MRVRLWYSKSLFVAAGVTMSTGSDVYITWSPLVESACCAPTTYAFQDESRSEERW